MSARFWRRSVALEEARSFILGIELDWDGEVEVIVPREGGDSGK